MKWTFPNLRLFLSLAVITGGIYPLAVTLVSLIFFPHQAHGSLIRNERGEIIASELVAQPFISAKYFWPRPSAGEYATMPSGASNLSWTSGKLVRTVAERKAALLKAHNLPQETPVPAVRSTPASTTVERASNGVVVIAVALAMLWEVDGQITVWLTQFYPSGWGGL